MSKPFVAQWGILGCGWISSEFTQDISRPPSTRGVTDISHAIAAVGSRSSSKAEDFIAKYCPEGGCAQKDGLVDFGVKGYGSYEGAVNDSNVNIVYVGTMNICHYSDAKLALEAGKHCLLEKPATLNAAEWKTLTTLAKSKNLFLMEAVWTRFNPNLLKIQKSIHQEDAIGDIRAIYSDHSMDLYGKEPDTHRCLSAELAGGGLLDVGVYPLVWALTLLYHYPQNHLSPPSKVASNMLLHPKTGVDLATSYSLTFPNLNAIAYCSTNLFSNTPKTGAGHTRIVGSKGEIYVRGFTSRPHEFVWKKYVGEELEKEGTVVDGRFDGFGLYWEADEVARCLRDGLLECSKMSHGETQMPMDMFDKIRSDGGYKFLPGLEKVRP